jgi:hypothetical protein
MAADDWIRGYRSLLAYRAPGYPARTLERYFAYMIVALVLALVLIVVLASLVFWSGRNPKKMPTPHTLHRR